MSEESSDTIDDSTSKYSTSSESETDEEDLTKATSFDGSKRSKPAEGKATAKTTRPQRKNKVTALDSKEIEDLAFG